MRKRAIDRGYAVTRRYVRPFFGGTESEWRTRWVIRNCLRMLRIVKGKPAFKRAVDCGDFSTAAADNLEQFHLEHTEYRAVYQNKAAIKKFLELRLSAIRNGIVQSKNIKDEEIPIILKGLRLLMIQFP